MYNVRKSKPDTNEYQTFFLETSYISNFVEALPRVLQSHSQVFLLLSQVSVIDSGLMQFGSAPFEW